MDNVPRVLLPTRSPSPSPADASDAKRPRLDPAAAKRQPPTTKEGSADSETTTFVMSMPTSLVPTANTAPQPPAPAPSRAPQAAAGAHVRGALQFEAGSKRPLGSPALYRALYLHMLARGHIVELLPGSAGCGASLLRGSRHAYVICATQAVGAAGKFRLALRADTGAPVAIKEWRSEDAPGGGDNKKTEMSERFAVMQELAASAAAAAAVHPTEVIDVKGKVYGVMQLMDGDLLSLSESAIGPAQRAALGRRLLAFVGRDLGRLHRQGLVHRDVKPENILWTRSGTFHLADYGAAEKLDEAGCFTELVGTPGFFAPEFYHGEGHLGAQVDLWSLGRSYADFMLPGQDPLHMMDWGQGPKSAEHQGVVRYFNWRASMLDDAGQVSAERICASGGHFAAYFRQLIDLDQPVALMLIGKLLAPPGERSAPQELRQATHQLIAQRHREADAQGVKGLEQVAGTNLARQQEIQRLQVCRHALGQEGLPQYRSVRV